jgi:hypothetical protein
MIYEEILVDDQMTGKTTKHIIIDNGDNSFKSFPADPANPEYAAFLESLNDNSEAE